MTPSPENKTIGEIARQNTGASPKPQPQKPPSQGSLINTKWVGELKKFIGLDVTVRSFEREYKGTCLAIDLTHGHVILRTEYDIALIRNPHEVWRGAPPRTSQTTGSDGSVAND